MTDRDDEDFDPAEDGAGMGWATGDKGDEELGPVDYDTWSADSGEDGDDDHEDNETGGHDDGEEGGEGGNRPATVPAEMAADAPASVSADMNVSAIPEDDEFEKLWESLEHKHKQVALAYAKTSTKAEAARECGYHPDTIYDWPDKVWKATEMILRRNRERLEQAHAALVPRIVAIQERALDPEKELDRVSAEMAQYLTNRLLGKPTQRQEVAVEGGIDISEDEEDIDDALEHLE
jgi:transposase-like protein